MVSHPTDALPAYVAGRLATDAAEPISEHLSTCAACRADAAAWRRLAAGLRDAAAQVPGPPPALLAAIRARISRPVPRYRARIASRPLVRAAGVLVRQWRLVRWPVWAVSGAALLAGTVLAAIFPGGAAESVLATVVPLVAALAIAGACGTEPADELARATLTSPRVVLLARLTVVLGTVTAVGLLATLVLALPHPADGALGLVLAWLGPLVPLCALSFALSVLWRPMAGVGVAMALWLLRGISTGHLVDQRVWAVVDRLWAPDRTVLVGAVGLVAVAVLLAPRRAAWHT